MLPVLALYKHHMHGSCYLCACNRRSRSTEEPSPSTVAREKLKLHHLLMETAQLDRRRRESNKRRVMVSFFCLLYRFMCTVHFISVCATADDASSTPPSSEVGSDDIVEIQIRPHPLHSSLHQMAIKTLATSSLCTVSHLLRYIKLNMTPPPESGSYRPAFASICQHRQLAALIVWWPPFAEDGNTVQQDYSLHVQIGDDYSLLSSASSLMQISRMVCGFYGFTTAPCTFYYCVCVCASMLAE